MTRMTGMNLMTGITGMTRMTEISGMTEMQQMMQYTIMQMQGAFVSVKQFVTQDSSCTHVACWCNQFMIFTTS